MNDHPDLINSSIISAIKHLADAGAVVLAGSALAGALPSLAAGLSIIWYGIRIYEWWRARRRKNSAVDV